MATKDKAEKAAPFKFNYGAVVKDVERQFALTEASPTNERLQTSLYVYDVIMGGGLPPGRMITFSGKESSGKSTELMQALRACAGVDIGFVNYWDYEGSFDRTYMGQMVGDAKLNEILTERMRIWPKNHGEDFFEAQGEILRNIPDKKFLDGKWWLCFPHEKEYISIFAAGTGNKYNKQLYDQFNLYCVESDASPQGLIFVDSWASMVSKDLDVIDPSGSLSPEAKMFSAHLKKVAGKLEEKRVILVGTNQIREKPMAQGCLHYDTMIHFVDGRVMPIGDVVNQQFKGKVWSLNEETRKLEPRKIIGWHNNGTVEDNGWVTVNTQGVETPNGFVSATVTPNHEVYTDDGWKQAQFLTPEDSVVTKYESVMNGDRAAFIAGMVSADCSLVNDSRSLNATMRIQCKVDPAYVQWKKDKLGDLGWKEHTDINKLGEFHSYITKPSYEFGRLRERIGRRDPTTLLEFITPLSLAIMYMDDGWYVQHNKSARISYKRFKNNLDKQNQILDMWAKFGVEAKFRASNGLMSLNAANTSKLFSLIQTFIPPCMQRKLPEDRCGRYEDFELDQTTTTRECFARVLSVHPAGERVYRPSESTGLRGLYDITVDGTHNYLAGSKANGVIVHNSPFYEPGGKALEHWSSIRNWQTPRVNGPDDIQNLTDHTKGVHREPSVLVPAGAEVDDHYRYVLFENKKNKTSLPYLSGWGRIWTRDHDDKARGWCPVFDAWYYLAMTGQVKGLVVNGKQLGVKMKAFQLQFEDLVFDKMTWYDFKRLILLRGDAHKDHCESLGISKPPKIRDRISAQIRAGSYKLDRSVMD